MLNKRCSSGRNGSNRTTEGPRIASRTMKIMRIWMSSRTSISFSNRITTFLLTRRKIKGLMRNIREMTKRAMTQSMRMIESSN
jgi:hypothetical protein